MAARWPANCYIFLLLFDSIGGVLELARSRNKVHAKKRKISFSRNLCSAICTYSTVCKIQYFSDNKKEEGEGGCKRPLRSIVYKSFIILYFQLVSNAFSRSKKIDTIC